MRKIQWTNLILLTGGILPGFFLKSLLSKNGMSDWWLAPFIVFVCLAYIRIDLKQEEGDGTCNA